MANLSHGWREVVSDKVRRRLTEGTDDLLRLTMDHYYYRSSTAFWRAVELGLLLRQTLEPPILDLGCADGFIGSVLFHEKKVMAKAGIDLSYKYLTWARANKAARETYETLAVGDACHLPYENGSFRTVLSNCVMEHIPDLKEALGEISRVLARGGRFVLTVPSEFFGKYSYLHSFLRERNLGGLAERYHDYLNAASLHYHCYDVNTWGAHLEDAGLHLEEHRYYVSPLSARKFDAVEFLFNLGGGKIRIKRLSRAVALLTEVLGLGWYKRLLVRSQYPFWKSLYDSESKVQTETGLGLLMVAEKRASRTAVDIDKGRGY